MNSIINNESSFYCPLDGTKLIELNLGILMCKKCKTQFIPTKDEDECKLIWNESWKP
jgi:hypothetical protein